MTTGVSGRPERRPDPDARRYARQSVGLHPPPAPPRPTSQATRTDPANPANPANRTNRTNRANRTNRTNQADRALRAGPAPARTIAVLAVVAALAAACGSPPPLPPGGGSGGPALGTPAPAATPDTLAGFLGNGLACEHARSFGLDRSKLLTDPTAPGGRVLRVTYPKGSASPTVGRVDNAPAGGAQAYLRLPRPVDTLTLRYQVRFPPRFDFVKGGKLPGLFGGAGGSGGEHYADGFSTRYMWRTGATARCTPTCPGSRGTATASGGAPGRSPPASGTRSPRRSASTPPAIRTGG
jgi:hypothetical protein